MNLFIRYFWLFLFIGCSFPSFSGPTPEAIQIRQEAFPSSYRQFLSFSPSYTGTEKTKGNIPSSSDFFKTLSVAEPLRSQWHFPATPVHFAAMQSCGGKGNAVPVEGFARQLFVGWETDRLTIDSLDFHGIPIAISRGEGMVEGVSISLFSITVPMHNCVRDLSLWSSDSSLLNLSSEAALVLAEGLLYRTS